MSDTTTVSPRRGGGFRWALAWLAILGLFALVAWLASERNARTWYLVPADGRLVVMKGYLLPTGRGAFETSDPAVAQAYAPLVPPPGKPLPGERSFDERGQVDQAIYDLVSGWARDEIASGDPARLERGLGYLARAEKLPGLSGSQRDDLAALRAESGYQEAMRLLGRAVDDLREASDRLRRASTSRSPHAAEAGRLLRELEPAVEGATGAFRRAEGARPPPPPAPAAPDPSARVPGPVTDSPR
jgi:hypothetical protein